MEMNEVERRMVMKVYIYEEPKTQEEKENIWCFLTKCSDCNSVEMQSANCQLFENERP